MAAASDVDRRRIADLVSEILEIDLEDLTETSLFIEDHDADSLRAIEILSSLEREFKISVVPQARVEILREALMEEDLYTVFTVEDVFKDLTYTARMDCYVVRDGEFP